jgi:hypothetical protein
MRCRIPVMARHILFCRVSNLASFIFVPRDFTVATGNAGSPTFHTLTEEHITGDKMLDF